MITKYEGLENNNKIKNFLKIPMVEWCMIYHNEVIPSL